RADRLDAVDEMAGAAVAQVVTVDGGHDDVTQPHRRDGFREVLGLVLVERVRAAVRDVAERAAARADVAHDHERRGALAEAFTGVRARGFLAHGVQPVLAQDRLQTRDFRRGRRLRADPGGLAQRVFRRLDLDRDAGHFLGRALL